MDFSEKRINLWNDFLNFKKNELTKNWVFRGQGKDYPLSTSLERSKKYFNVKWADLPGIEHQMIRGFKRHFQEEKDYLLDDLLYCISLMQHHGAPTRLLDFTWSVYIGVFFALENASKHPVLWCINVNWLDRQVTKKIGKELSKKRWTDEKRDNESFAAIYKSRPPKKLVQVENPIRLSKRHIIQRGIFLCPGDITCSLKKNFKELDCWNKSKNVKKIFFDFTKTERESVLTELLQMNITRASLFPGLDGYSQSMKQFIPLFKYMAETKAGIGGSYAQ